MPSPTSAVCEGTDVARWVPRRGTPRSYVNNRTTETVASPYLAPRAERLQRFGLLRRLFDGADVHERLFGQVVPLAFEQLLEAATVSASGDVLALEAGEDFGDVEGLARRSARCVGRGATVSLSSSDSSSMPRMAMMSCRSLYFCSMLLHLAGGVVVLSPTIWGYRIGSWSRGDRRRGRCRVR